MSLYRVWFRCSIIAASVVVFPEPVGPVDEHESSRLVGEASDHLGQPHLLERRTAEPQLPEHGRERPALTEHV
jgi:hypothetical protein